MKIYSKSISELSPELEELAKNLSGRAISNKKIGSPFLTITEVGFFLGLTPWTIKRYYYFAEIKENRERLDLPELPCYYKVSPSKHSMSLWLRKDIYLIKEFSEWIADNCNTIYIGIDKTFR